MSVLIRSHQKSITFVMDLILTEKQIHGATSEIFLRKISRHLNPCFQQILKECCDNTLTAFPGILLTKPIRNVLSSLFTEVNPRPPFYPFSTATPKIKRSKGRSDTISDGGEGLSLTNLFFNAIIIFRYFLLSSFSALIYLFFYFDCLFVGRFIGRR